MEPLTIALLILCAVMLGIIIWLAVKKWNGMSTETRQELADRGMQLVQYLKTAWSNDGKIDISELEQIMKYLIGIIAFLAGMSESSVKIKTGTEELLADQNE